MLWASKDYEKTQSYYERGLRVAREMGDQTILAHTLNRIGNLEVNISLPLVSEARHQEALTIFKSLGDEKGLAETLDYLAMTCLLSAKSVEGQEYSQEAARLFLKQGDELHLASTLATAGMRGANLQTMHVSNSEEHYSVALQDAIQARRLAENIGWRSGSAFASFVMATCYGLAGKFGMGLASAEDAIAVAEEIGHEQWTLAGRCLLGGILLEMLDPEDAIGNLKTAAGLAERSNSLHWHNTVCGFLAGAWIALKDFQVAESLLEASWPQSSRPRSLSEGKLWLAKAELRLAQRDYEAALQLVQMLYESVPDARSGVPIPRLGLLQGACFGRLGHPNQAVAILTKSLKVSEEEEASSITWKLYAELAQTQRQLDELTEAERSLELARELVDRLAESIDNPKHQHIFQRRAAAQLKPRLT
jgi:tetratricopeptide (TPR) repeat protein